jgi:Family of unknown function (DUF6348)
MFMFCSNIQTAVPAMTSERDYVELAASVMQQRGHDVINHETWLEHRNSGIAIRPHLVHFFSPSQSCVQSVSTVTTSHPRLAPDGVLEYQHALGATLSEALREGFDQWLQLDFVVLLDALRDQAEHCSALEFKFPRGDGPDFVRRALLGPIGHMVDDPERASRDVEHPFCPCCLLTNTYRAFRSFIEGDGFFGIRLLAIRNDDGSPQADCRVNGEDWETGQRALCDYVHTWPQAGFEVRKQYVVLQTIGGQTTA